MNVLFVNTSDHAGGAAIAAQRLLKALRAEGVEAQLLCLRHTPGKDYPNVTVLKSTLWRRLKFALERLEIFLRNGLSRDGLFAIDQARFGNDITRHPAFKAADVVHLHWTNQSMLSLHDAERIFKSGKRVVITMHDMWTFTGICHQAAECDRWLNTCGRCPMLRYPRANDLSHTTFERKRKAYASARFTAVGCSQWLTGLAQQSPLLKGKRVVSIPNPIDTTFYAPAGHEGMPTKQQLREQLGLPQDKQLLLFTAFKVTDPNKGIDYLIESIALVIEEHPELRNRLAVVIAGGEAEKLRHSFAVEAFSMGYVTDEAHMRSIYQACDLLLMPTLMDNLPNTIVEAMACGVPCVAFEVGGVPQMVTTGVNGYLAQCRNSLSFSHGIVRTLSSQSYAALCRNARAQAVQSYSEKAVAQSYIGLYNTAP